MIEIVAPGPLATIQDFGRRHFLSIGVGLSGAMDPLALKIGNRLVGNEIGTAAIEFTIGSFGICFHQDTLFALTGADCGAVLDGFEVPSWWCMRAKAGQMLKAGAPRYGMRSYLSVAGGFDVPDVLGSASTDLKGGFGGLDGRALQAGDWLALAHPAAQSEGPADFGLDPAALEILRGPEGAQTTAIRFVAAAEYGLFTEAAHGALIDEPWTIQPDSNRIGYRLSGPKLDLAERVELLSHGILPGTIQVPPSGQPVIQLSDANTCGGYPKIGAVIGADLWRLGQARLGGELRFEEIRRDEAIRVLREQEKRANDLFGKLDAIRRVLA